MNQEHSAELKTWETEINQATIKFDEAREKAFKNFISKIRNKQVFIFRPVGPFMEKKRPFESSPKNQNQDKRRKFDGNKNVTSKIPACSMCKEKKNKEFGTLISILSVALITILSLNTIVHFAFVAIFSPKFL